MPDPKVAVSLLVSQFFFYFVCQAIQKANLEGAKIHAENSIRQKNQALNYRRMSARIDAVAARVQTALTMKQVCSAAHCCELLLTVPSIIGSPC